jgi:hypothetical protein
MCPTLPYDVPFENGYDFSDRLLDVIVGGFEHVSDLSPIFWCRLSDSRLLTAASVAASSPLVVDRAASREP